MARDVARLTRDQVAQINAAVQTIFAGGAFGQVVLVIEKDRIAQIDTTVEARDVAKLTRDQVAQINLALQTIFAIGAFGQVILVIDKDRIGEISTTFSVKYKSQNGSGDALASTG